MAGDVIATVKSISGTAYARETDGNARELRAGDSLRGGEAVVTPDGGNVEPREQFLPQMPNPTSATPAAGLHACSVSFHKLDSHTPNWVCRHL